MSDPVSVFASYQKAAYPYEFVGTLHVHKLCGGVPADPKVVAGWIKAKLGAQPDQLLQQQVAEVMVERGVSDEDAQDEVIANAKLVGFKRDPERGLFIEGRQLKAAIKEAASVRWPQPFKWGKYANKSGNATGGKISRSYFAEHVFVKEERLYLGRMKPSGVEQRFIQTFNQSAIGYSEYADDVSLDFTILTDHKFTDEQWALLWETGAWQGIGATRSQGFGQYTVTRWDQVK